MTKIHKHHHIGWQGNPNATCNVNPHYVKYIRRFKEVYCFIAKCNQNVRGSNVWKGLFSTELTTHFPIILYFISHKSYIDMNLFKTSEGAQF